MRFTDRICLITGGASGIGAATARRLASEGATVVLADINAELGRKAAASIGDQARFVETDISREESIRAAVAYVVREFGRLDCAANVAGVAQEPQSLLDGIEAWNKIISVNAQGLLYALRAEVAAMMAQGRGGAIANVSSAVGIRPSVGLGFYSVSKFAGIGLTANFAAEFIPHKIRVNGVAPGAVDTPMLADLPKSESERFAREHPLGRFATPEDIAATLAFLLSDDAAYIAGQTILVDGGWKLAV